MEPWIIVATVVVIMIAVGVHAPWWMGLFFIAAYWVMVRL